MPVSLNAEVVGIGGTDQDHNLKLASEYLEHWAAVSPDLIAITFIDYSVDRAGVRHSLTFTELNQAVTATAAHLQKVAIPGLRAAILAPQGLQYVIGFLAALRAGLVAIPLFSPDIPGHGDRLATVFADCDPAVVMAVTSNVELVRGFLADVEAVSIGQPEIAFVNLDEIDAGLAAKFVDVDVVPEDIAYIQYTSGSTRTATGVLITHANIVANGLQSTTAAHRAAGRGEIVCWGPMYHDLGLVSVVGGGIVGGWHVSLMDPTAFLMKPLRWLQLLADGRNTISFAPNFAFDYVAAKVTEEQKQHLQMQNIQMIGSGAEPVRPDTVARFNEAFASCGLRPSALQPVYGLAEATVLVTGGSRPRPAAMTGFDFDQFARGIASTEIAEGGSVITLPACGAANDQLIAIAETATGTHLQDGYVGEIWVNGPNVSPGYWNKHELSGKVFNQHLIGAWQPELPTTGWMRSGDLGFIHDGELYVAGRLKDLIIVDGRNVYPQDLEATAEASHPVIGRHRSAAFSVPVAETEGVVIIAEISRHAIDGDWDNAAVQAALRQSISEEHRLAVHEVLLVKPNSVPRTSSGKIARAAARQCYLSGTFVAPR